jgi:type IV pilus assembly protein PilA
MKYFRIEYGFTLIEMLVVVVIVGILTSLAIPVYLNYTQKAKVTSSLHNAGTIKYQIAMMMDSGINPTDINSNNGELDGKALSNEYTVNGGSIYITDAGGVIDANLVFELRAQGGGEYVWVCLPGIGANTLYLPSSCVNS